MAIEDSLAARSCDPGNTLMPTLMIAAPGSSKQPDYFLPVERGVIVPIEDAFKRLRRRGLSRPPLTRWTVQEFEHVRSLQRDYRRDLYRVHRSALAGDRMAAREQIGWLVRSFPARFFAALRVAVRRKGTWSFGELEAQANQVDIGVESGEPVRAKLLEKHGKTRWALVPGTARRCMQLILRDALIAANLESPFEYSRRGLGPNAAYDAILRSIGNGYRHWLIIDIADFFPSVKPKHFSCMPLKERFIRNATFLPREVQTTGIPATATEQDIATIEAARLGLSLGSMVSPQIAGALTGRIIQGLPGDLVRVSFVDDIALGARSHGELLTIEEALEERLKSLEAGPLTLKFATPCNASDRIEFMQFRVRPGFIDSRDFRVAPSSAAYKRFRREVRLRHSSGATDDQLVHYGIQWAKGVGWLRPGTRDVHRDFIESFVSYTIDEALEE